MLTPRPTVRARLGTHIRSAYDALGYRVFQVSGAMYIAAASFIGWEALAVLISYATMAPIAVPLTVAGIAVLALVRRVLRRRDRRPE